MSKNLNLVTKKKLLDYLSGFISDNKKNLINTHILDRTKHLTVVLEDIYQPHNASAVLRSCDCFGIQDVHIIENRNKYNVNPDVALGSSKWINIHKYNGKAYNSADCLRSLKEKGYKIVATLPAENNTYLEDLNLDLKTALVFGTEMEGLTEEAIGLCDEFVKIRMYGFTESLNISVSVAISLHYLTSKLRQTDVRWQLTEEEIIDTQLYWVKNIVKDSDSIEKLFLQKLSE